MQSVYGYYDGTNFINIENIKTVEKNRKVIITILDDFIERKKDARYLGKITDDNYGILLDALEKGENVEYEYDDPFFSLENVKELTRRIKDIESGKTVLVEHELIEVKDDE